MDACQVLGSSWGAWALFSARVSMADLWRDNLLVLCGASLLLRLGWTGSFHRDVWPWVWGLWIGHIFWGILFQVCFFCYILLYVPHLSFLFPPASQLWDWYITHVL